jgi:hypothetical protein
VTVLAGVIGMVGVLLAAGGVSKLRSPAPTVRSMRTVGLPASGLAVRSLAVVELVGAALLVVVGGQWVCAVGTVLFAGFTAISVRLVRLGPAAVSCGCFGDRSSRPSWTHVVVDAGAAVVLFVGAVVDPGGLASHWSALPGQGWVVLGLMALGGYLLVALMTVLPDTMAAVRADDADESRAGFFRLKASR